MKWQSFGKALGASLLFGFNLHCTPSALESDRFQHSASAKTCQRVQCHTDVPKEESLENRIGAEIHHRYEGDESTGVRHTQILKFEKAIQSLERRGKNLSERTSKAAYVITDRLPPGLAGEYITGETKQAAFDNFQAQAPNNAFGPDSYGLMAIDRSTSDIDDTMSSHRQGQTVLHESVHNQVSKLTRKQRETLLQCINDTNDASYRPDDWQKRQYGQAWKNGWITLYAGKNRQEDIAETTTMLLTDQQPLVGYTTAQRRVPHGTRYALSEREVELGFDRLRAKTTCLHDHQIISSENYGDLQEAWSEKPYSFQTVGYNDSTLKKIRHIDAATK